MDIRVLEAFLDTLRPKLASVLLLLLILVIFFSRSWLIIFISYCGKLNPSFAAWALLLFSLIWFAITSAPIAARTAGWMDTQYDVALERFAKINSLYKASDFKIQNGKIIVTDDSRNLGLLVKSMVSSEEISLEVPEEIYEGSKKQFSNYKVIVYELPENDPLVRSRFLVPIVIFGIDSDDAEAKNASPLFFHSTILDRRNQQTPTLVSAKLVEGNFAPRYDWYIDCIYQIQKATGQILEEQVIFGGINRDGDWSVIDSQSWKSDADAFLHGTPDYTILSEPISLPDLTANAMVMGFESMSDGNPFNPSFAVFFEINGAKLVMKEASWLPVTDKSRIPADIFFHDFSK